MKLRVLPLAGLWILSAAGCPEPLDPPDSGPGPSPPPTFDGGSGPIDPPSFGSTTLRAEGPAPIAGGTLAVLDNDLVLASDPDADQLHIVRLSTDSVQTLTLEHGDEPGRAVAAGTGFAYAALRRGGAVVRVDVANASMTRIPVCAAPRGLAYDSGQLYVTCVDGDIWTLADGATTPIRFAHVDEADLRDIVVQGSIVYVSRFRSTEVIEFDRAGNVLRNFGPSTFVPMTSGRFAGQSFQPAVAWRMIANPRGGVVMVHERGLVGPQDGAPGGSVSTEPGGYGSGSQPMACGQTIVHGTVSALTATGTPVPGPEIVRAVLPVDIAVQPGAAEVALALAGNSKIADAPNVVIMPNMPPSVMGDCIEPLSVAVHGQAVAVAYTPAGTLVAQTREPSSIWFSSTGGGGFFNIIPLNPDPPRDTGFDIFHSNSGGGIACASCHPEGGDDGRVWVFDGEGTRRTQNLRGGIAETAPFHWSGDQPNFTHLTGDVFVGRMSGIPLDQTEVEALERWVDRIPTIPQVAIADPAAAERGRALFNSQGCAGCHSGPMFTNNQTVAVGTGEALQVPSLVGVRWRGPFLHDGRAATLRDRFDPRIGGGDQHGFTTMLGSAQIDDLVAYLDTL